MAHQPSLRVLMVSPEFRPLVGGYQRAAERLSSALGKAGNEVVIVTERRDRTWPALERADGFELRRLPCWYRPRLHAISSTCALAIYLLRRGRSFDVWHVHQYGLQAAMAIAIGKLLHRPVVLKLTNSADMGIRRSLGEGRTGRLLSYWHRRVSACFATSRQTRTEAIEFGIAPERVHLVPNGLDGKQFAPGSAQDRRLARDQLGLRCERLVLFVGRLSWEKNPLALAQAWAAIDAGRRTNALLAIVGAGPQAAALRARIDALGVGASVLMAGERDDTARWYRAADFLVIPSHIEGLSNTMIEALASGLPVISTRVSGSEVLAEPPAAGVLVAVGHDLELAAAIELLLNDVAARERLARHARAKFETTFEMTAVARSTCAVYADLRQAASIGRAS